MKLIMERFEKFSEKTLNEQRSKEKPFAMADKAFGIIRPRVRRIVPDMTQERSNQQEFTDYFTSYSGFNMHLRRAETAARKQLSGVGGYTPEQLATIAADEFVKLFISSGPQRNSGIGNRKRAEILKPIVLSALKAAAKKAEKAKLDTPDRLPGDNPEADAKKPISPMDTTQQGGMMGKIEQTNRIINKGFSSLISIGIREPADLRRALSKKGFGTMGAEVTVDTIKAVKAFQEEYNMSPQGKRRPLKVDGLFGGNTARAFRRFKK